jgi:hypothetical protein
MEETKYYKCNYCFNEYTPNRRRVQIYCSNTCRSKAHHAKKNNTTTLAIKELPQVPIPSTKTKVESMSMAGVGNAAIGSLAADALNKILTKEENKPLTKGDLNKLLEVLNQRYHLVKNIPPRIDGAQPYFDLTTNNIVFFKSDSISRFT